MLLVIQTQAAISQSHCLWGRLGNVFMSDTGLKLKISLWLLSGQLPRGLTWAPSLPFQDFTSFPAPTSWSSGYPLGGGAARTAVGTPHCSWSSTLQSEDHTAVGGPHCSWRTIHCSWSTTLRVEDHVLQLEHHALQLEHRTAVGAPHYSWNITLRVEDHVLHLEHHTVLGEPYTAVATSRAEVAWRCGLHSSEIICAELRSYSAFFLLRGCSRHDWEAVPLIHSTYHHGL